MTKNEIADQLLEIARRATNNADTYYYAGNDEMSDLYRYIYEQLFTLQKNVRNGVL